MEGAGCPKVVCFGFFDPKVVCCVFLLVHRQALRLSQTHHFADRQYARVHRAVSDMSPVTCKVASLLSFLGPPWSQSGVPIGALLVVLQQWLLVASVRRTFECRVGEWEFLWPVRTLGRRQVVSSRHSDTSGRRVMRARLVFRRSGASGIGCEMQLTAYRHFWSFQNKRAPPVGRH